MLGLNSFGIIKNLSGSGCLAHTLLTFTSLIPKVEGVGAMKNLQPIGVLGSAYKNSTKLLGLRLKKVIHWIVSQE